MFVIVYSLYLLYQYYSFVPSREKGTYPIIDNIVSGYVQSHIG